jgi:hypothetical protein
VPGRIFDVSPHSQEEKVMNRDAAAAVRQIQLALRTLLGGRLQMADAGKAQESTPESQRPAMGIGSHPSELKRSEAKASSG